MSVFTKRAIDVFAPTDASGNPRGASMGETMVWGTELERATDGAEAGRVDQAEWTGLDAIDGTRAGQPAIVFGPDAGTHTDPVTGTTVPNEGQYYWSVSPEGWRRAGSIQRDLVHALNSGGTADAVEAISDGQFDASPYRALITVNFTAANTGAMTLAIDGETPRPLVTNTGEPIPAGYVSASMYALVQIDSAGNYRLFSYGDPQAIQAAVEALLLQAEAARDAAQAALSSIVPNIFATKAAAEAYNPTVAPDFIQLAGYDASGDGGGLLYGKEASEPSDTLKFPIIVAGAEVWFGARLSADKVIHAVQAGIVPGAAAADINTFLTSAAAIGAREVRFAEDEWAADGQINWPAGIERLDLQGALLSVPSALAANSWVLKRVDALTQLPDLVADVDPTTETIEFVSAHGLSVGDAIGVRNTTPSSLNTWRSTYYDGQPLTVREVVSVTEITVWERIDPRGPSGIFPAASTEVFKYPVTSKDVSISNAILRAGSNSYGVLAIDGAIRPILGNIDVTGGTYAAGSLANCVHGRDEGCKFGEFGAATGQQYGLVHSSVCHHTSIGVKAFATRHAMHHGNTDGLGSIPPRGNAYFNPVLGSEIFAALDFGHGNILDHRVQGGNIAGIVLGGSNNHIDIDVLTGNSGFGNGNQALIGGEFHDTNHHVKIGRVVVDGDGLNTIGNPHADGVIGFAGSGSCLTTDTQFGGVFSIEIGKLEAKNWTASNAPFARYRNRGFTGRWGLRQKIGQIVAPAEADWFSFGPVSGTDPAVIDVPTVPDRFDPTVVTPTHGWTTKTGFVPSARAAGDQRSLPDFAFSVADAGASIAPGEARGIAVPAYGLSLYDTISVGADASYGGTWTTGARIASSGTIVISVLNSGTTTLTLPPLTWTAYVTKR